MQQFICNENLQVYRQALAASTDDEQSKVLSALLRVLMVEQAAADVADASEPGSAIDLADGASRSAFGKFADH